MAGEDESGVGARDICVRGAWGADGSRISDVENLMNVAHIVSDMSNRPPLSIVDFYYSYSLSLRHPSSVPLLSSNAFAGAISVNSVWVNLGLSCGGSQSHAIGVE